MNLNDLRRLKIADHPEIVGVVLATLIVIVSFYKWYSHRRYKLPPGPWGLPFLGYFPFLSKHPFKDLRKVAERYGNIFSINLGGAYTVVLNDFESVKEAFNNPAILDRPEHVFDFIPNGLGFAGHNGAEWIEQRRFAMKTLKDIGIGRIAWESSVETEVEDFVQLLEQQGGKAYDVHDPLSTSVSNNITSIILGKPLLRGDPRRAIVDGGIEGAIMSFSSSSLASLFPFLMQFLAKLGLSSHADTFKKVSDFHNFINAKNGAEVAPIKIANLRITSAELEIFIGAGGVNTSEMERRKKIPSAEWNEEIFIDGYLKEIEKMKGKGIKTWFNENNLTGSSQALLIGGSDTSRTFLSWIFLAMAAYPEVQKNVQKEIDAILGKDGKLPWSERAKLPYTYATLLETNRWRSITPLGVLHCASEDTKIGQYDIPKGSSVLPNIYALHNDPKYWKDPDSFRPERFLDKNGCLIMTRLDSYAPFSVGRRICPGEMIAMMEIFHYFTAVMQRFDIRPLENSPPNVDDGINGATYQPVPQKLKYIPRG